jgi:hypothetical protein
MVKNVFLLPVGDTVSSVIIPQILNLKSWCDKNESIILTSTGSSSNICIIKNILSTLGHGVNNPVPSKEIDYYYFIEKDIIFKEEHLELLSKVDHPFLCGWKSTDNDDGSKLIVAGKWDEEFHKDHGSMPVLSYDDMVKVEQSDPERTIEVDYSEFGFVRIHRSIFEQMKYPFFRLNIHTFSNEKNELIADDISFCLNCAKETGIKPSILAGLHVNSLSYVCKP